MQRQLKLPLPQIVVSNVELALADAARAARAQFKGPVIGVAGSNGKTTVKEMLCGDPRRSWARACPRAAISTTISACR